MVIKFDFSLYVVLKDPYTHINAKRPQWIPVADPSGLPLWSIKWFWWFSCGLVITSFRFQLCDAGPLHMLTPSNPDDSRGSTQGEKDDSGVFLSLVRLNNGVFWSHNSSVTH
jgi:hypothetical protein